MRAMSSIKLDWFLCALVAMLAIALLSPAIGMSGGPLRLDIIARYGVAGVFFLYGLTLAPEKMRAGFANWRVHVIVQAGTFVLFPAIVLAAAPLLRGHLPAGTVTGLVYLAVLPSTISSSVALTSLARGNVPVAIFNASLSSLIGVLFTPIAIAWYASTTGGAIALVPVFLKVLGLVIAPMAAGQLLHRPLLAWSRRHANTIKLADRVIILAIVLNSLSDAVGGGIWANSGASTLALVAIMCIVLFTLVYAVLWGIAAALDLPYPDRIACAFCGSKKSLATGVPMAGILFGSGPLVGLIVAPLILFHFLQLVIVSVIAGRIAARPE